MEARVRDPRVHGEANLYRLFDVGYEIRLDRAAELLASSAPQRPRPARGEAQAPRSGKGWSPQVYEIGCFLCPRLQ